MRRYLWIGLGVWLLATLAIRLAGGPLFHPRSGIGWGVLFAVTAVLIALPISALVRRLPSRDAGLRAAVLIVVPGMVLDTGSVLWFPAVFPNLPESAAMPFAALLLWCYGVALVAGLRPVASVHS